MSDTIPEEPTIENRIERLKALALIGRAQAAQGQELGEVEKNELTDLAIDLAGDVVLDLASLATSAERIADALEVANEYTVEARSAARGAAQAG